MSKYPKMSRDKFSREVKEYLREMNDRTMNGTVYPGLNYGPYANDGGHGSMKLPPVPSKGDTHYFEGRCGMTRNGDPGRYRFVFLVDSTTRTPTILKRYFSDDHYASFYEITD